MKLAKRLYKTFKIDPKTIWHLRERYMCQKEEKPENKKGLHSLKPFTVAAPPVGLEPTTL